MRNGRHGPSLRFNAWATQERHVNLTGPGIEPKALSLALKAMFLTSARTGRLKVIVLIPELKFAKAE